jgi:ABC-2 type transport system permease protein
MKAIWSIAKKDLWQTFRDRSSIILMLAMPMIFITAIGLVVGTIGGSSGPTQIAVAISNQDNGYVSQTVTQALTINNSQVHITLLPYNTAGQVSSAVAAAANTNSGLVVGVVIPAGTTTALQQAAQQNQPTSNLVQLYESANSTDARASFIQNIVTATVNQLVSASFASTAAVQQVEAVCHQSGNHCAPNTINAATIAQIVGTSGANATKQAQVAQLAAGQARQAIKVSSFDLYVPGYAVFFALFGINAIAGTILQEKEDGTFRRLLIAPVQPYALLAGKLLAQFLLTVVQIAVLFIFGYVFFHITIGDPLAVILLILATSFGVTGLGIALVTLVKTRRQLVPAVTLVTLLSGIIGGVFFPSWLEPNWMQQIARISLPYWATSGLNDVMIYGRDLGYVVPDILGLLVYGLICYLIALRLFRFQEKTA